MSCLLGCVSQAEIWILGDFDLNFAVRNNPVMMCFHKGAVSDRHSLSFIQMKYLVKSEM